MQKLWWCLCGWIFLINSAMAQTLTASVDVSEVPLGEVFNLKISYDGNDGGSLRPDFSPLYKDFAVYSSSSSMRSSFINGVSSQIREWTLSLQPKQEGMMTIPSVKAGQYQTQPLNIKVLPAGSAVKSAQVVNNGSRGGGQQSNVAKFAVDTVVDNKEPYVQQQTNLDIIIDDNVGLQFTAEPTFINAEDWVIKSLGQPETEANGNGGRRIKLRYALFPQKSGKLEVPTVQIEGFYQEFENKMMARPMGMDLFKMFNIDVDFDIGGIFGEQKPVFLTSKPVEINVKPKAKNYGNGLWVPAKGLILKAKWNDDKVKFNVGEAVSREITLMAAGVADTQLPDIEIPEMEGLKVYPENPEYTTMISDDTVVAKETMRVVYIPQKGGVQEIPAIRIPWFNVRSGAVEMAVVPAQKIKVEGESILDAVDDDEAMADDVSMDTEDKAKNLNEDKSANVLLDKVKMVSEDNMKMLFLGIVLAFVMGMLFSLLLRKGDRAQTENRHSASELVNNIQDNLKEKDYRKLRDNLLLWGNECYKECNIRNLNDLSECVKNEDFSRQMQILNGILYASSAETLDKMIINETLKNCGKNNKNNQVKDPLPKLYK